MVQTGDPTGTGKGGTSIWGRKFEDEFHETLKVGYIAIMKFFYSLVDNLVTVTVEKNCFSQHNTRGVVSMANSGPDTNGSQFFIIYSKQPHLDMKYTIIGK